MTQEQDGEKDKEREAGKVEEQGQKKNNSKKEEEVRK